MGTSEVLNASFLREGGEMGACMRRFPWHDTPLGEPAGWPQSLKTAVSLMLRARQPMFIGWGPQHISLYNDGYIPICGAKHPHALGRPMAQVWSEIWEQLSALNDAVMRGESLWYENMPFDLAGRGESGPSYFSFSYTPLLDDRGAIGGIFCSAVETTASVRLAHSRATELQRQQRMFEQAPGFICTTTGPHHVFDFVNDAHRRLFPRADVVGKTVREAFPDIAGQGFYERLDEVYRTGERHVARGMRTRLRDTPGGPEREVVLDFVYAPVLDETGRVTGTFCEGQDVTAAHAAQQALLEKEEQLRLAIEAAEVGLWDLNPASGALYWPPRVRAMFGITHEQPVTMWDFYAGLHPEDREATAAAFAAACDPARRALYDVEYRTIGREDGLVRWVAAKGRGVFDATGCCVRVIGTAIDISARKASEQAMEVALEASRTGTFHWDIQNNRLTWDSALDRLFGLRPGEVVRSLDQFVALLHPDDRAEVIARCERCRDEAADFEMEFRVVYPEGSIHWLYDRGRTFVDAAGRAKTMTGACVDITQRREAEAALRASEQVRQRELRSLADNSPDIIARFDSGLRHVFVNAAVERLTGLAPQLFLGRTNEELGMPGDLCEQWNRALRKVFEDGRPFSTQFEMEHNGVQRHFAARLVPELAEDGSVQHVLGVTRDITDLWQAQRLLRTGLHVMQRGTGTPQEQRVRGIMERQLDHMVRLVDELLDIARISQGTLVLTRETLQLQLVLEHAVDACRPLLDAQGHTLVWQDVDPEWHVHGDITRLVQVVGNLLNNAAKDTPHGGRVSLRAVEDGEGLAVIVEDDGIRRSCWTACSSASCRWTSTWSAPRAAWASASAWSSRWWKCTAAGSAPKAPGRAWAVASWCGCRASRSRRPRRPVMRIDRPPWRCRARRS